ncbi:MAG TPA: OB-fold domain-containing protein [Pseudorhodoferax sp.]|nr:OB-fold domain-containing protein [Pseudorhodoferax sp.]
MADTTDAQAPAKALPSPILSPESQGFWAAAREGRFMLGHCQACEKVFWYPRALCPHCFSASTGLKAAAGGGTVYSYSVMRRVKIPYALAYVTLDEGVTVLTNLVAADLDRIRVGMPVELAFVPAEDGAAVPVFRPSGVQQEASA